MNRDQITEIAGSRILLRTERNGSFSGILYGFHDHPGTSEEGILVQLDRDTGFSVWCPLKEIKEIIPVKASED